MTAASMVVTRLSFKFWNTFFFLFSYFGAASSQLITTLFYKKDTDFVEWIHSWKATTVGVWQDGWSRIYSGFRGPSSNTCEALIKWDVYCCEAFLLYFSQLKKGNSLISSSFHMCSDVATASSWTQRGALLWALYIHVLVFSFFSLSLLIIRWHWEPPGRTTGSCLCSFELLIYYLLVFLEVSALFETR